MQEKVNFYADFYRAGKRLSKGARRELYEAILAYLFEGIEPKFASGGAEAVWEAIQDRLGMSRRNAVSGKIGGMKSWDKRKGCGASSTASSDASSTDQSAASETHRIEGEGEGEGEKTGTESVPVFGRAPLAQAELDPLGEPRRGPSYAPPSPAEVEAYVEANCGLPIDGEAFCGWFSDHGWPKNGWGGSAVRWAREDRDRASRAPRAAAKREVSADEFAWLDE